MEEAHRRRGYTRQWRPRLLEGVGREVKEAWGRRSQPGEKWTVVGLRASTLHESGGWLVSHASERERYAGRTASTRANNQQQDGGACGGDQLRVSAHADRGQALYGARPADSYF